MFSSLAGSPAASRHSRRQFAVCCSPQPRGAPPTRAAVTGHDCLHRSPGHAVELPPHADHGRFWNCAGRARQRGSGLHLCCGLLLELNCNPQCCSELSTSSRCEKAPFLVSTGLRNVDYVSKARGCKAKLRRADGHDRRMLCAMTGQAHRLFWMRSAWWCQDCRQKFESCCEGGGCPSVAEFLEVDESSSRSRPDTSISAGSQTRFRRTTEAPSRADPMGARWEDRWETVPDDA